MRTTTAPTILRRAATAADTPLLRALFEQSRDDLALLPAALVDLQYRAQARQIALDHPDATREVLVADDTDAGVLVLAADAESVRVVDIVVARTHRRRGIAEAALREVIAEAGVRPVRLSVWSQNAPARALYERLGFTASPVQHGGSEGYVAMERIPGGHA